MSDFETLQMTIATASRRRRWLSAWLGFWRGFVLGASLWLLALVGYKLLPLNSNWVVIAGIAGIAFSVAGFIQGWWRRSSLMETARWIEQRQALQERLSTALELANSPGNWQELVIADAARHARQLDARRLLPIRLPVASRWVLLVLALGAGLGFVPEYRSKNFKQKQNDRAVIRDAGHQLSTLTRRTLSERPPAMEKTREELQTINELGNQLAKASLTRGEAMKELASASEKLKSDLKELGRTPAMKPLERAARHASQSGGTTPAALQKQIDSLQKSLGEKGSDPEALNQLKEELKKAQQNAAGMPGKNAADSAAAKLQLAQSLAGLAEQAREMGLPLENLDAAIAALQANQSDLLMKDLNAAVNDLEKLQQMAKALQQLQQQAAAKIGKDLAEQLKNGQAEAAQKTLEQMVAQLQQKNLSPEQLKKLLEEVAQAVDPAGEYGKAKEFLKSAAAQLQTGQQSQSAQSLAEAARELEKLLQQMGDAESLAKTLEALQKAQMCVGNGQSWAKSSGKPGSGKGGKAGRGVGTWAEESGWLYYPEFTERWDNSGAVRPDVAARGLTDRGEGELADTLAPTKIKGQINPGGPMPSITLRGVSIKGQSQVQFQEAVNAAQSEAQSALNQDQVPRAYQGAVREYFDDLKE